MTIRPVTTALQVNDKVSFRNTGKYWCNTGTISKINKRTNIATITLAIGQKTTMLLKNLQLKTDQDEEEGWWMWHLLLHLLLLAPTSNSASRTRRHPWYRDGRGGRGGGGGNDPPWYNPKEKSIEEKTGISGIPWFCTPAENGDKASFDKVRSFLKSHVGHNLYRGKDVTIILLAMTDAVLAKSQELSVPDKASKLKVNLWNMEVEEYIPQKGQLECTPSSDHLGAVYQIPSH